MRPTKNGGRAPEYPSVRGRISAVGVNASVVLAQRDESAASVCLLQRRRHRLCQLCPQQVGLRLGAAGQRDGHVHQYLDVRALACRRGGVQVRSAGLSAGMPSMRKQSGCCSSCHVCREEMGGSWCKYAHLPASASALRSTVTPQWLSRVRSPVLALALPGLAFSSQSGVMLAAPW